MNRICKILCGMACVFAFCFLVIGYASVQDDLYVNGSLSVEGEPLLADNTFVFDSNYLKAVDDGEDIPEYTVYGTTVDIVMFNHDGLKTTYGKLNYDIEIAAPDSAEATLTPKGNADDCTLNGGTKEEPKMDDETYVLKYDGSGSVTVTATSSNTQTKELKAQFNFVKTDNGHYKITVGEKYVQLDVYTVDALPNGLSLIGLGSDLIPDPTNDLLKSNDRIGALNADSHYTFLYFSNEKVYYKSSDGELGDDGMIYFAKMPSTSSAKPATVIWIGGVKYDATSDFEITQDDKVTATYTAEDNTLVLENFFYEGQGYIYTETDIDKYFSIYANGDLTICSVGENYIKTVDNDLSDKCWIYGIKVDGHLQLVGDGKFHVVAGNSVTNIGSTRNGDHYSYGIVAKNMTVMLSDDGILDVKSGLAWESYGIAICKELETSYDQFYMPNKSDYIFKVLSGTVNIEADKAHQGSFALYCSTIDILRTANVNVVSKDASHTEFGSSRGIWSFLDTTIDTEGTVDVIGYTSNETREYWGIAVDTLIINSGNVTVKNLDPTDTSSQGSSVEQNLGIFAYVGIKINGGKISVAAGKTSNPFTTSGKNYYFSLGIYSKGGCEIDNAAIDVYGEHRAVYITGDLTFGNNIKVETGSSDAYTTVNSNLPSAKISGTSLNDKYMRVSVIDRWLAEATVLSGGHFDGIAEKTTNNEVSILDDRDFTIQYKFENSYSDFSFIVDRPLPVGTRLILLDNKTGKAFYKVLEDETAKLSIADFAAMDESETTPAKNASLMVLYIDFPSNTISETKSYEFKLADHADETNSKALVTANLIVGGNLDFDTPVGGESTVTAKITVSNLRENSEQSSLIVELLDAKGSPVDYPAGSKIAIGGVDLTPHHNRAILNDVKNGSYDIQISGLFGNYYKVRVHLAQETVADHPMANVVNVATEDVNVTPYVRHAISVESDSRYATDRTTFKVNYIGTVPDNTSLWVESVQYRAGTNDTFKDVEYLTEKITIGAPTITEGVKTSEVIINDLDKIYNGIDKIYNGIYVITFKYGEATYLYAFVVTS